MLLVGGVAVCNHDTNSLGFIKSAYETPEEPTQNPSPKTRSNEGPLRTRPVEIGQDFPKGAAFSAIDSGKVGISPSGRPASTEGSFLGFTPRKVGMSPQKTRSFPGKLLVLLHAWVRDRRSRQTAGSTGREGRSSSR